MSDELARHFAALRACRRCPDMIRPVVAGRPVRSPVYLLGQAPGAHEGRLGRPFAWTAGRTLFRWFAGIGVDEEAFRGRVSMAAVCRCFPGKNAKGGDRVPSRAEVESCAPWIAAEMALLRPALILPVGKLAVSRLLEVRRLEDVVGAVHRVEFHGHAADAIPLPHPSGASTWHRTEPGATLLRKALARVAEHPAWRRIRDGDVRSRPGPG